MGKFISGLMKKVTLSFKSAIPVLLIALCVLTLVAIWWAGPMLDYNHIQPLASIVSRVIASVIFVLLCFVVWGFYQWKALNQFKAEQHREQQRQVDPYLESEERQEVELNQVMQSMKDNLNQRNYLYALPWYLVLGTENTGKTSLVNRSGQSFVFSSVMKASSGKSSDNLHHFDWWIGEEAVLIDPDGELLTQGYHDENSDGQLERRLWVHFIEWLERTRSRRPLNGVVITVDMAKLASESVSERKTYATLLRARLRELMETLSTRMPVYVTLTKMDLLEGFDVFFRHYSKSQREEVLGFTFSLDSVNDLDKWLDEFNHDYGVFVERIHSLLAKSLLETANNSDRRKVYAFARQLAGLKDVLHEFLTDALSSDQFSTSALVRGVYFTSVFQQGVPTNAFDDAASRRYGLNHAIGRAQDAANSSMYFSSKLFTQIIYPEAGLASDNFRVAKHKRRVLALSCALCLMASVLVIGSWHGYYLKNVTQSNAVLAKVNEFRHSYPDNLSSLSQKEMMVVLDTIRDATLEVGFFRDKPKYVSDMGLYQGHVIGPKVESTYLALLEERFLPILLRDLAAEISRAKNDEEKLEVLRVFRMMIDKSGRHKSFVLDYFSQQWQRQYAGDKVTQGSLLSHLDYAMEQTDLAYHVSQGQEKAVNIIAPYKGVLANAQYELSDMPIEQRVYRSLKSNSASYLGAPVNLRTQIGPVFDLVFEEREIDSNKLMVSRMLTKDGYENYFLEQVDSISELALIDSWVLGQTNVSEFSSADKTALKNKILSLYVVDYTTTWRAALNEIDVKYFLDINDAIMTVENMVGSAQPFNRLLGVVEENTRIFNIIPDNKEARDELLKSSKYQVASMIQAPFSDLNSMFESKDNQVAYFDEVQESITQLLYYLKAIQDAPDRGRAALEATRSRLNLSNTDPVFVLKRIASGLPSPLDGMVNKIADESWYAVKQEAVKHLESRWQKEVFSEFQLKFADRYPFNRQSRKDVDLSDFESFFSPNGTLANFYNDQLKMFIEDNVALSGADSQQALIRPDVIKQLNQAKIIGEAYFNRKGMLDVDFTLEPISLSNNKRRAVINVDGQFIEYSHGPRHSVGLIWPNTLRKSTQSKITLVPNQSNVSPRSITRTGPWSLFRLLDSSDVIGGSASSVDYNIKLDEGNFTFRVNTDASTNVFREQLLGTFELSKTLY